MKDYKHEEVEKKWKEKWEKDGLYKARDKEGKRLYVLDMFPYPSGAGLHVGHVEGYTATDIYTRFKRMQGYNVLHPMGWDAFGLPAENYAIKTGVHPRDNTDEAINTFKHQITNLGLSYDWEKEIGTHEPEYYKWTQWFFLLMYKMGLAYRKKAPANWCPSCQTVLANEQVVDGKCERCDTEVVQKDLEQWFFKITDYADRLLEGLKYIDWPESTKLGQKNWIGRSEGAIIRFRIENMNETIEVFTSRPDTIFGATFLVLAPEHPLVKKITKDNYKNEVEKYIQETRKKTELQRQSEGKEKTGVFTGACAINPVNGEKVPIWVADYVLMNYGTGAIMGVPAHDQRDMDFAKKYNLDVVYVIKLDNPTEEVDKAYEGEGSIINSDFLDGLSVKDAKKKIIKWLEDHKVGRKEIRYKLRDWLISRQRYWGAPIPMIKCPKCGYVPALEKDLPVTLPYNVDFKPTGESPLIYSKEFHKGVTCPKCGAKAQREVDTMDTFVCSSWYFFRFTDPHNSKAFAQNIKKVCLPVVESKNNKKIYQVVKKLVEVAYNNDIEIFFTGSVAISALNRGFVKDHGDIDLVVEEGKRDKYSKALQKAGFANIATQISGKDDIVKMEYNDVEVEVMDKWFGKVITRKSFYQNPVKGRIKEVTVNVIPIDWLIDFYNNRQNTEYVSFLKQIKDTKVIMWLPVDLYVGGAEHTVLHLLYSRFFTKVLFDAGYITFDEPFYKLRHPGIILAEDRRKMSKRWGNVINPDDEVKKYGADTVRMYEIFMGPLKDSKAWNTKGEMGVRRFLEKVWRLQYKVSDEYESKEQEVQINKLIKYTTYAIEELRFNTNISKFMEFVNFLVKEDKIARFVWERFLIILAPYAPFITEELWGKLGNQYSIHKQPWPKYDKALAKEESVEIAVQFNGKTRGTVTVQKGLSQDEVLEAIKADNRLKKRLQEAQSKGKVKIIYVQDRVINVI